jgi:tetratricopeptide (TPR) repeat protein
MIRRRLLCTLCAPALLLAGCQSGGPAGESHARGRHTTDQPAADNRAVPAEIRTAQPPLNEVGPVHPIENYKQERLAQAMRGLRYDSGRVEIDAAEAAKVVTGHDAGAAAAKNAEGNDFLNSGLVVESIGAHTSAVLLDPDNAEYYSDLGVALTRKGLMDEALAAYRSSLDRNPANVETHVRLAKALQSWKQPVEAIQVWQHVLTLNPDSADVHSRLARLMYFEGRYAEAWEHVHAAEALGGSVPPQFRPMLAQHMPEPQQ